MDSAVQSIDVKQLMAVPSESPYGLYSYTIVTYRIIYDLSKCVRTYTLTPLKLLDPYIRGELNIWKKRETL